MEVTLIDDSTTGENKIIKAMKEHDRIIMCGHGCPDGLFGNVPGGLIVNKNMVPVLREKECIFIWCNADEFVKKNYLTGFYTGMFISEVGEARCFNINISQKEVDYSNNLFAALVRNAFREIDRQPVKKVDGRIVDNLFRVYEYVASSYNGKCPVINFNRNRLYFNTLDSGMMLTFSNYDPSDAEVRETEHQFKKWSNYMEEELNPNSGHFNSGHSNSSYSFYDDEEMFYDTDDAEMYYEWEVSGTNEPYDEWLSRISKENDIKFDTEYDDFDDDFGGDFDDEDFDDEDFDDEDFNEGEFKE
jgi:hypothetical protein